MRERSCWRRGGGSRDGKGKEGGGEGGGEGVGGEEMCGMLFHCMVRLAEPRG